MEELQVIETTSGRQFKPWASKEDVQAAVQDPASITAITSEIASGKQAIASAINAKGGTASAAESFTELAEAVEEIPNFSDMAKLAGIIAGGNYTKNALQGHNENVKYGKTEIVDNFGAFEKINVNGCFEYWDLLERVVMPILTEITSLSVFNSCSTLQEVYSPNLVIINSRDNFGDCISLREFNAPNLVTLNGNRNFQNCTSMQVFNAPNLATISGSLVFGGCKALRNVIFGTLSSTPDPFGTAIPDLRNITIGQDTNINLPFQNWTATNVIAEGQSGIDELNTNLQTNLIAKLYQGGGKILRLGATLYDVTTQETRDMVTAKGWTLQRG